MKKILLEREKEQGYALVSVLIVTMVLSILIVALLYLSESATRIAKHQEMQYQAYQNAKSGLDTIAKYYNTNPYIPYGIIKNNSSDTYSGALNEGSYAVTAVKQSDTTVRLQSVGTVTGRTETETINLDLAKKVTPGSIFSNTIYTTSDLVLTNISGSGPVQSAGTITGATAFNPVNPNMPINTMAWEIPSSFTNYGNYTVPQNSNVTISDNRQYDTLTIDNNGSLTLNAPANGKLELVVNNLVGKGDLQIQVTGGKAIVYIKNTLDFQANCNFNSLSTVAEKLTIFLGDTSGTNFQFVNNFVNGTESYSGHMIVQAKINFYGFVYAPNAFIETKGGGSVDISGAIVCNKLEAANNSTFNFKSYGNVSDLSDVVINFVRQLYSKN